MVTTTAPGRRRKHAAARSRLVAGALSVALFVGLGTGMAARAAARDRGSSGSGDSSSTVTTNSPGTSDDSGWASGPWSATPSQGQDQSAATTTAGS